MLSREQLDILSSQYVVALYDDLERQVISDIARRVQKTGRYTETAEIMARSMREQGYSTSKIQTEVMKAINADQALQAEIAKNTREYKAEVAELIKEMEAEALAAGDKLVAQAGTMSWNDDLQMWKAHDVELKKDKELSNLFEAVKKQTQDELRNITRTTAFKGNRIGTVSIMNAYQREMDLALIKTSTGVFSYGQAVKDCVYNLAAQGLRTVDYESGKSYRLDTAARMCIRTAGSQLAGRISEMNLNKTGTDLVYVDAHAGARPEHAEWQGKVYVYNKSAAKNYPEYGDFWSETDYGSVAGLKGVNCSHNFYPYWPGDVIPEYKEPDPVTIDGKEYTYYEATQEQRRQERNIRQTKRMIDIGKALGDNQKVAELQRKLSDQYKNYGAFSNAAELRPKYERFEIYNGTNIIQTATRNKESERERLVSGKYATSDKEIKDIMQNELKGVRFSAELVYNGRIQSAGKTHLSISPLGNRKVRLIEIGKQKTPEKIELIDTLLHEELEARIFLRAEKGKMYKKLDAVPDKERHEYIQKVIEVGKRMKGLK